MDYTPRAETRERATGRERRHDVRSRCEHVGLLEAVLRDALTRPARLGVVPVPRRALVVRGADRDHIRIVPGRVGDCVRRCSEIARRRDDRDPVKPRLLNSGIERIRRVRLRRRGAEREVHDADVVVALVIDDELEADDAFQSDLCRR
jgi:hypothetical protein